jgi:hypothetical protein
LANEDLPYQLLALFVLALPIASIAWTITHEEAVSEFRDICVGKTQPVGTFTSVSSSISLPVNIASATTLPQFSYLSLATTLFADWRGYLIAGSSLVWWQMFT